jgi:predicted RND superfamily exporter protein
MNRKQNFWGAVANLILRNRFLILGSLLLVTLCLATQWQYMRFTFSEANLLPNKHCENLQYDAFVDTFGEEGNLIVIAVKDERFFEKQIFDQWITLNDKIETYPEVDFTLSTNNSGIGQRRKAQKVCLTIGF